MLTTFIVFYIFVKNQFPYNKLLLLITIMAVLGLGAIVEIIEFIATLTIEQNGVGSYRNNMLDLVANFLGSLFAILVINIF